MMRLCVLTVAVCAATVLLALLHHRLPFTKMSCQFCRKTVRPAIVLGKSHRSR